MKLFSGANGVKIFEKADVFKNIFVKLFRPNSKRVRNIQLYPNAMNAYDNVSNRLFSGGILWLKLVLEKFNIPKIKVYEFWTGDVHDFSLGKTTEKKIFTAPKVYAQVEQVLLEYFKLK